MAVHFLKPPAKVGIRSAMATAAMLLLTAAAPASPYELVARFPGQMGGYNHVFRDSQSCQRARTAILIEWMQREASEAGRVKSIGGGVVIPGPGPAVICVPI